MMVRTLQSEEKYNTNYLRKVAEELSETRTSINCCISQKVLESYIVHTKIRSLESKSKSYVKSNEILYVI